MQPETSGVRTWQWVVTVIVIIVLILLGYYMFRGDNTDTTGDNGNATSTQDTLVPGQGVNRVVVTDQFPGNIVYLSSVQLTKPGFVAVYDDNNGTPGEIIGTQYFDAGINPGRVTLTRSTVDGEVYYAILHTDNGDKVFNATQDVQLINAAGNPIMMIFRGSASVSGVKE